MTLTSKEKWAEYKASPMFTDKRLVPGYKIEVKPKPGTGCERCSYVLFCNQRVKKGIWVLCERPDYADLRRAELNGRVIDSLTNTHNHARLFA